MHVCYGAYTMQTDQSMHAHAVSNICYYNSYIVFVKIFLTGEWQSTGSPISIGPSLSLCQPGQLLLPTVFK